jgi:hypothetical protein
MDVRGSPRFARAELPIGVLPVDRLLVHRADVRAVVTEVLVLVSKQQVNMLVYVVLLCVYGHHSSMYSVKLSRDHFLQYHNIH